MKKNSKLSIVKHPDPILHTPCAAVEHDEIASHHTLLSAMATAMYDHDGIGIAANQVGKSLSIAIIHTDEGDLAVINPKITWYSSQTESAEEGCLSIPGHYDEVKRAKKIKIEALDLDGKKRKFSASGLFARVLQHEVDHLNGMLFIDRVAEQRLSKKQ